jgi:transcriptional regulator with XRE-family HTH domain
VSDKTIKRLIKQEVDAPRPSTLRRIATGLEIPVTELTPEYEGDQLERIEDKLDAILDWMQADGAAKRKAALRRHAEILEQARQRGRERKQEQPSAPAASQT